MIRMVPHGVPKIIMQVMKDLTMFLKLENKYLKANRTEISMCLGLEIQIEHCVSTGT